LKQDTFDISKLTDHLFRQQSGKMVAVLTKIFGIENLQLAEDVVQDTLLQALDTWKLKGIPDNPSAWLYRVARNKAIDVIRHNKFSVQYDFSDSERQLLESEYTLNTVMDSYWKDEVIADDLLQMMFACCHPEISEEGRITLILKTLCGFSTAEIAKSFFTSEDTISKRLYRTKEFFRERKIRPEFPDRNALLVRVETVLRAIYLIFNEGYSSTHSDTVIRKDLLTQAVYLCGILCRHKQTQLPEVYAAMALMCLHAARVDSRTSSEGEIILLPQQDRSKWDKDLIEEGNTYLNMASFGNTLTTYHIEAAIAYEHCAAATFEATNWERILMYYDWLTKINPSSIILLNRLAVIYKLQGGQKALEEIEASGKQKEWEKHYLYHSLLGDIYSATDKEKARRAFEQAIGLTQSAAEQELLRKKIIPLRYNR
jgi:RNA polymerase sigma-70 factor (ECF subfamily)